MEIQENKENSISSVGNANENINTTNDDNIADLFPFDLIGKLADNHQIFCKSQQRNEEDIPKAEKMTILTEIFNKSKSNFLSRFGQFLNAEQVQYFEQFKDDPKDGYEIMFHLKTISRIDSQKKKHRYLRNRRYAALKRLEKSSYFSETEMMKRNPLLYEQLVGQYLSVKERKLIDRRNYLQSKTFVGVLMDGIEKEQMAKKRKEQEEAEGAQMEESDSEDESDEENPTSSSTSKHESERIVRKLWGEMEEDGPQKARIEPKDSDCFISSQERKILREEFVSLMYQNFLDGKDEEFDYAAVDENEEYDNLEILEHDEEERYFDAEDPEDTTMDETKEISKEESSEDELDIYMNALNQHPAVCQLSEDIKKL